VIGHGKDAEADHASFGSEEPATKPATKGGKNVQCAAAVANVSGQTKNKAAATRRRESREPE
jgi:hypothetical protein